MATIPKHRQLPDKESKLFKELLTSNSTFSHLVAQLIIQIQYEHKQYKKGIKAADTILKKFPNHGETLALKALTILATLPFPATASSLPKQEEAEATARTAVKKDITSHITWHVLGIIAKNKKDYAEASRAFAMARKQDNDNIPIIRDSVSLSLHTRQYPAAVSARHHLLLLRPNLRAHWIGLMVAHQLNGDHEEAIEVYDGLMSATTTDGATAPEQSQLLLNVVKTCVAAGRDGDALRRLDQAIKDGKLSARGESTQLRAELLVRLGRQDEAEDAYRALLEQNSDNLSYYAGFLRTKGLEIDGERSAEETVKILHHLDGFAELYPRSIAPKRLALRVASGDEFRSRVRPYLVDRLERGIPSLFVDVKSLYTDSEKLVIVGEVVQDLIASLEKEASLHGDDTSAPPTALLWAYYFLALHISHPLNPASDHARALELLDVALQHTPTLPEIYMAKARVLKRAGDPALAAHTMEEARLLDGQDRFLNGKAAKYWLRAGEIKRAEELLAMFTKKDMTPLADLTDLQCLWFLREEGDAYQRAGQVAMALKRYMSTVTVFQDYEDDQYDFHTYCMRRMTLSAYMSLMKYEDQLRSHPAFFRAALSAIDIFTRAHDDPTIGDEKLSAEEEAERKKAAKKAQKAESKAKKAAAASGESKKDEQPIDADPHGLVLIKTETPLVEAAKVWNHLGKHAAGRVETWLAAYDIRIRQGAYLAALQAILAAREVDAGNAEVPAKILHILQTLENAKDLAPSVKAAVEAALPVSASPAAALSALTTELERHSTSPTHILGKAKLLVEAHAHAQPLASGSDAQSQVLAVLRRLAEPSVPVHVEVLGQAVQLARSPRVALSGKEVDTLREALLERAPRALSLAGEDEAKRRREEAAKVEEEEAVVGKADV